MPDFMPPAALLEAAKKVLDAVSSVARSRHGMLIVLAYVMTKLYHEDWNEPGSTGKMGSTFTTHEGEDYYIQIARCTAPADGVKAALMLLGTSLTVTPGKPFVLRYLNKTESGDVPYKLTLEVDTNPPPSGDYTMD